MPAPDLSHLIGLPPEEAIKFLEQKGYAIGFKWQDVWQQAHSKAFTVAGVMKMDVLTDIRTELTKALKEGGTLADFKNNLEPTLQQKGWMGKGYQVDQETGEIEGKRLNSRRLDTIFRTNMQSSYMAGRWKQQRDDADLRPYWEYVAIMDDRTRPAHRMMNGRIFRYDDPIWETNYPPNGFNCRCRVRTRSERDMERKGLLESSSEGRLETIEQPINRQGDTRPTTAFKDADGRRFVPDAGFGYNPGQAAYQPDLNSYSTDVGRQYVQGTLTGPAFENWYSQLEQAVKQRLAQTEYQALNDKDLKSRLRDELETGQHFPVAVIDDATKALLGVKTKEVRLSDYDLVKQFVSRQGQDVGLSSYYLVQPTIETANVIVRENDQMTAFFKRNGQTWSAVLQQTKSGQGLYLKSFRRSNAKDIERMKKRGEVLRDV